MRIQLDPFTAPGSERISVSGPDVLLIPEAAEAIGLALHELATNAVKYGALSVPVGRITISWAFEDHGPEPRQFLVNWIEREGLNLLRRHRAQALAMLCSSGSLRNRSMAVLRLISQPRA